MPKDKTKHSEPTTLIHFKLEVCRTVDPQALAFQIFGTRKHLVVMHQGKKENPHWHFQGMTSLSPGSLKTVFTTVSNGHTKRLSNPTSRPLKQAKAKVDETGYQYMLKESPPNVVTSVGFTPDEIDELHEASKAHVKELQNKVFDYLVPKIVFHPIIKVAKPVLDKKGHLIDHKMVDGPGPLYEPVQVHNSIRLAALDYYMEKDIMWPPNLQKLILFYMAKLAKMKLRDRELLVYKMYICKLA